jgi:hypothetical protein
LSSFTPNYLFPYPLPGDSVANTYRRIQELAERIEATYTILGINLDSTAALLQVGDTAGGDLTGTYPNPIIRNDAITTAKILNRQVTGNKIDEETVDTINLVDDSVTTDKLAIVALKDGTTAVTQVQSDNSTRVATTAYVDAYVAGSVPDGAIGTAELADGAVTNVKVNAAAAISYSKLNLANSIVNADVAASAAISYSKLNLANSITTADLAFDVATQSELNTAVSNAASALSSHESDTTSIHGISDTANLVYTNDSRLTDSRTPTGGAGGVLSGSYPNPGFAVDMATQSELDNHASDTTSVHGIADTSVLATQTDVSTAVSNHSSDTTNVHGITDTTNIVYTNDSRLSDSRTPSGAAGGDLAGSYPNPTLATTGTAGTYTKVTTDSKGRVTSGTTLSESDIPSLSPSKITGTAVITTDARLSDARTPTAHATTHNPGQSDALDLTKIVGIGTTLPTLPNSLYPAGALFGVGTVAPYMLYRSTGTAWDQLGGAGGSASVTTDDVAPTSPADGDLWYDSTTGKTFVWYEDGSSNQWVEVGTNGQLVIPLHGAEHVRGGNDIIDGDRLTVDYVPSRYTRNSAASGAGNNTDLTAHLSGIDNNFEKIRVDTNGRITLPYQPRFSVTKESGSTVAAVNKATFSDVNINIGSCWSAANNRFTAPVNGDYYFEYHLVSNLSGSFTIEFRKNGTAMTLGTFPRGFTNIQYGTCSGAGILTLNANDYIEIWIAVGTMHTNHCSFTGYLIG